MATERIYVPNDRFNPDTRPLDTMIQVLPFRSFYKAILAKAIPRFQFKLPRLVVIESRHLSYPSFTAD